MKKIVLILQLAFISIAANAQWVQQNSGTYSSLSNIFFANETHGWASSYSTHIFLRTVDGGQNWETLSSLNLHEIYFADTLQGWAVIWGVDGADTLVRSIDGGFTWQRVFVKDNHAIPAFSFPTDSVGYLIGQFQDGNDTAKIYKSIDAGTTWNPLPLAPDSIQRFNDIDFIDNNTGYVASDAGSGPGTLYKTQNGGSAWNAVSSSRIIHYMEFLDENIGHAGNLQPEHPSSDLFRTNNGGITWDNIFISNGFTLLISSHFLSYNFGWYTTLTLESPHTSPCSDIRHVNGSTYPHIQLGIAGYYQFGDIYFTDSLHGWAVGSGGNIWHTSNGGGSGNGIQEHNSNDSRLIYPNPATDYISISPEIENILRVQIISIHGQVIYDAVPVENINVAGYNPGIYIVRIVTGDGEVKFGRLIIQR